MRSIKISYTLLIIGLALGMVFPFVTCNNPKQVKSDIVIRFDDYGIWSSDEWVDIEEKLIELHEKYGVKITFGVVPKSIYPVCAHPRTMGFYPPQSDNFTTNYNKYPLVAGSKRVEVLKKSVNKGISEVAQHGYYHPKYYSNITNGEFYGYDYDIQHFKIFDGKGLLDSLFATNTLVFIPPHNTYDGLTLDLLQECGFSCVSAKDVDFNAPQDTTLDLMYLPFTTEDFETILKKYESNKGLTVGHSPTDVLLLHHTSFTDKNGRTDKDKIKRYDYFLSLIYKYKINNYHISEAAKSNYLIKSNQLLNKHLYNKLNKIIPSKASTVLGWTKSQIILYAMVFCIWLSMVSFGLGYCISTIITRKLHLHRAKKPLLIITICTLLLLIYRIVVSACLDIEVCFNRLFSTPLFACLILFSLSMGTVVSAKAGLSMKYEK